MSDKKNSTLKSPNSIDELTRGSVMFRVRKRNRIAKKAVPLQAPTKTSQATDYIVIK